MWPEIVHCDEVQSRLLNDGVPVERAMSIDSEVRTIPFGSTYRIELPSGPVVLYGQGGGWFRVAPAELRLRVQTYVLTLDVKTL